MFGQGLEETYVLIAVAFKVQEALLAVWQLDPWTMA